MGQFIKSIARGKKQWFIFVCCYLVFNGCFSFPHRMMGDKYFSTMSHIIMPIWLSCLLACIFYSVESRKYLKVFLVTFVFNGIGLLCRIWLEWGEAGLIRDLTTINVIIFLLALPILITSFYKCFERYNR